VRGLYQLYVKFSETGPGTEFAEIVSKEPGVPTYRIRVNGSVNEPMLTDLQDGLLIVMGDHLNKSLGNDAPVHPRNQVFDQAGLTVWVANQKARVLGG